MQGSLDKKTLGDFQDILKRRKLFLLIPFSGIALLAAVIAIVLPPVYRSKTTILIEDQQIPAEFVQSTVQTLVEETLQSITQRIMSRNRLLEIIDRFSLYEDLKARKTTEEIIEGMREDIRFKTISAEVKSDRTRRESMATIAFELSYEGESPEKVQKVTNTLASFYLEENLRYREEKAKTTTAFMDSELERLKQEMDTLEAKIAEFKEAHLQVLPEMAQINLQAVQRLEREVENVDQQIQFIKERKVYLESQLVLIDQELPRQDEKSNPKARLEYLYTAFFSLKASQTENHPDFIKMQREIELLEKEVGIDDELALKRERLRALRAELTEKKSRLSDPHPDVVGLKKSIDLLAEEIDRKQAGLQSGSTAGGPPQNPAYLSLKTQIVTADLEVQSLERKRQELTAKRAEYQQRLELTPQIESQYRILTRDYENARARYQEVLNKLMLARSAEGMEKTQKGQRFTIIDAAALPERPHKPNRLAIAVIGLVLGLFASGGLTALREITDQAIRSETFVAALTGGPVLTTVPYIQTRGDLRRRRVKWAVAGASTAVGLGLTVGSIHILYSPLPVLWFRVLRKLVAMGLVSP